MSMRKICYCLSGIALTFSLVACGNDPQKATTAPPASKPQAAAEAPAGAPPAAAPAGENAAAPVAAATPVKGKVMETMDASGYTYVRLDNGSGKEIWAAIPKTELKTGEEITLQGGSVMPNFNSKTLNRTFDEIIFASGILRGDQVAAPAAEGGAGANFGSAVQAEGSAAAGAPSGGSTGAVVPFADLKVEKATAANGHTVTEVFTQATDLNTKPVTVKGQVVKISRNIMGKNWLHIQDGTGDPQKNTHDLVVTTDGVAEKGAVVTVEGVVAANKDFGSGYKYDVIVEDAKIAQ